MKLRCAQCILALLLAHSGLGQGRILHGQVVLVDENGLTLASGAGVEITIAETGASDRTDGKGLFRIQLMDALQPGVPITLDIAKPGWAIWQPEGGKTPIPQGLLTIKLLPKGSKKFWTDHFIQSSSKASPTKPKLK